MDSQAIILAAGSGRRLHPLTLDRPKALLPYGGETLLERTIKWVLRHGMERITVVVGHEASKVGLVIKRLGNANIDIVENPRFREDKNILSLLLALQHRLMPSLVIEGDVIFPDGLLDGAFNPEDRRSLWYSKGEFAPGMYGGIVKVDETMKTADLRIVPEYLDKYSKYHKLEGMLKIGPDQLDRYYQLLTDACEDGVDQYYHIPWIENIQELDSYVIDLKDTGLTSINTLEEYHFTLGVRLVDTDKLRAIEGHSKKRVKWLREKILSEGVWRRPLAVEKNHHLVLDGMHRLEVARSLNLATVPCLLFSYNEVEVWSLRKKYEVSREAVIQRVLRGDIYPYKTAKHGFPRPIEMCSFQLEELKNGVKL